MRSRLAVLIPQNASEDLAVGSAVVGILGGIAGAKGWIEPQYTCGGLGMGLWLSSLWLWVTGR